MWEVAVDMAGLVVESKRVVADISKERMFCFLRYRFFDLDPISSTPRPPTSPLRTRASPLRTQSSPLRTQSSPLRTQASPLRTQTSFLGHELVHYPVQHQASLYLPSSLQLEWYLSEEVLEVQVWASTILQSTRPTAGDVLIGSAYVLLSDLLSPSRKVSGWYPLFKPGSPDFGQQALHMALSLHSCSEETKPGAVLLDPVLASLGSPAATPTPPPEEQKDKEGKSPLVDPPKPSLQAVFEALVVIHEALHLPLLASIRRGGEAMPNVYVTLHPHPCVDKITTPVMVCSQSPTWNHHCHTFIPNLHLQPESPGLELQVWSAPEQGQGAKGRDSVEQGTEDTCIGCVGVDLTPLSFGLAQISGWYNIMDFTGQIQGQLKVSVIPKERKSFSRATPPQTSHSQASFSSVGEGLVPSIPRLASHTPTTSALFEQLRENMKDLDEVHETLQAKLNTMERCPQGSRHAGMERMGHPERLGLERSGHLNVGHLEGLGHADMERTGHPERLGLERSGHSNVGRPEGLINKRIGHLGESDVQRTRRHGGETAGHREESEHLRSDEEEHSDECTTKFESGHHRTECEVSGLHRTQFEDSGRHLEESGSASVDGRQFQDTSSHIDVNASPSLASQESETVSIASESSQSSLPKETKGRYPGGKLSVASESSQSALPEETKGRDAEYEECDCSSSSSSISPPPQQDNENHQDATNQQQDTQFQDIHTQLQSSQSHSTRNERLNEDNRRITTSQSLPHAHASTSTSSLHSSTTSTNTTPHSTNTTLHSTISTSSPPHTHSSTNATSSLPHASTSTTSSLPYPHTSTSSHPYPHTSTTSSHPHTHTSTTSSLPHAPRARVPQPHLPCTYFSEMYLPSSHLPRSHFSEPCLPQPRYRSLPEPHLPNFFMSAQQLEQSMRRLRAAALARLPLPSFTKDEGKQLEGEGGVQAPRIPYRQRSQAETERIARIFSSSRH